MKTLLGGFNATASDVLFSEVSSDPSLATIICNNLDPSSVTSSSIASQDEKLAISAIQQQLMSCELPMSPSLSVHQQLPPYTAPQVTSMYFGLISSFHMIDR